MKIVNERRLDSRVRLLQYAAMLCALFAATGMMVGIHDANPAAGWVVPALAGIVGAVAFAAYWHWGIGSVVGVANPYRITAKFLLSAAVTALALAASAQGIAQGVAGHAAVIRELENRIEGYSKALDEAFVKGTAWNPLASAALSIDAGYRLLAQTEQAGQHDTGKGCGPRCAKYQEFAGAFHSAYERLTVLLDDAKVMRATGNGAITTLQQAAADGDQNAFMVGTTDVNRAITDLNGIDPRPIINVTGVTNVDPGSLKMEDDRPTKEFQALAKKLLDERQYVVKPTFAPISLGEATRSQMFGSAAHGWILAGAIDVMPFFFLIAVFLMSREPWMNQMITRTRADKKAEDRRAVKELLNPPDNENQPMHRERQHLDAAE